MTDFNQSQSLAKALHSTLGASLAVQSVLGPIPRLYDHPPKDPVYPYLTYGPMRSENIGGDDTPMTAHSLSLHLWSRYGGRAEIMDCVSAVSGALENGAFQLTDAILVSSNIVFSDIFRAPDGRTLHGLIRLKITTQPNTEAP